MPYPFLPLILPCVGLVVPMPRVPIHVHLFPTHTGPPPALPGICTLLPTTSHNWMEVAFTLPHLPLCHMPPYLTFCDTTSYYLKTTPCMCAFSCFPDRQGPCPWVGYSPHPRQDCLALYSTLFLLFLVDLTTICHPQHLLVTGGFTCPVSWTPSCHSLPLPGRRAGGPGLCCVLLCVVMCCCCLPICKEEEVVNGVWWRRGREEEFLVYLQGPLPAMPACLLPAL